MVRRPTKPVVGVYGVPFDHYARWSAIFGNVLFFNGNMTPEGSTHKQHFDTAAALGCSCVLPLPPRLSEVIDHPGFGGIYAVDEPESDNKFRKWRAVQPEARTVDAYVDSYFDAMEKYRKPLEAKGKLIHVTITPAILDCYGNTLFKWHHYERVLRYANSVAWNIHPFSNIHPTVVRAAASSDHIASLLAGLKRGNASLWHCFDWCPHKPGGRQPRPDELHALWQQCAEEGWNVMGFPIVPPDFGMRWNPDGTIAETKAQLAALGVHEWDRLKVVIDEIQERLASL